jgi:pimeloyl-ACP methyl ester carboxylesterase
MVRGAALLAAALFLAACGGDARPRIVKAQSLPGSYVDADGHRVYFDCAGRGSPTVVFLSGAGVGSSSFLLVRKRVATTTRACVYDRIGLGHTKGRPAGVRDARDQVRELEELLANARIGGPYVLVGHSWGGALARLYAGTHRAVKGLVLIDASSPGQDVAFTAALPPKQPGEPPVLDELRHPARPLRTPERLAWPKSLYEAGEVTSLGRRPVVVVTAGANFAGVPVLERVWLRLQDGLAALSTRSVHVIALSSGHFVQKDEPAAVVAAIDADVRAVRAGGRLDTCGAIFTATLTGAALRCVS